MTAKYKFTYYHSELSDRGFNYAPTPLGGRECPQQYHRVEGAISFP